MAQDNSNKKIIAFDVDGTLSLSRSLIDTETADLLGRLINKMKVAIISGGAFADIKRQVLDQLNLTPDINKNLILLPTNGGGFYTFTEKWNETLAKKLTPTEKNKIINAIHEVDQADPELRDNKAYGLEVQDRESQITYSAIGDHAPVELKRAWDPDFKKRIKIQITLMKMLPEFEVKIGGLTSIDVTPKGMDKAYGMIELMNYLQLQKTDILFIGDTIYEHGNDFPVAQMGVDSIQVKGPEETKEVIRGLLG